MQPPGPISLTLPSIYMDRRKDRFKETVNRKHGILN